MEYTREILIKRLEEYVGILPSELHDIAFEAVELLEQFDCSKGSRLINLDDAIEIISDQQDGSGTTYEILSHIIRDILILPIFETEQPHCGNLNSEWIPYSERMPSERGWYLITVQGMNCFTDMDYYYGNSEWAEVSSKQKVIAWMPLPKPYRKGRVDGTDTD